MVGKSRHFYAWMPEGVDSVLDVGCAYSHMLNLLGQKARRQFGIDFHLDKVSEASQRYPHIGFAVASGEALPFKDNSMEVVTFFEVLEHVVNERNFMKEVARVTRPGGTIMMSVPNKGVAEPLDMDNLVFTPALKLCKTVGLFKDVDNYYLRYHRHYSVDDLEDLFSPHFKIEKVYYAGLLANQFGFLIYKSLYLVLLLAGVDRNSRIMKWMHDWMDRITSWDFDHSYGKISDKLSVLARRVDPADQ